MVVNANSIGIFSIRIIMAATTPRFLVGSLSSQRP